MAKRFRLPEKEVAAHLASRRLTVKANVDEAVARALGRELEALGAVVAILPGAIAPAPEASYESGLFFYDTSIGWDTFVESQLVRIFVVAGLQIGLLFLALVAAIWLSVQAIDDYRLGLSTVEGYRATGRGDGIFGNTNDMALHMVTTLPIAIALLFNSRRFGLKLLYGLSALLILIALVLSYSRGAFIGLLVSLIFMGLKLGRNHRFGIALGILLAGAVFLVIAPGYGIRILSIFIPSLDPLGSADARRGELFRSLYIAVRHPFFGIGMGNYASQMSLRGLVTHNAYTQVASEMGLAALVCYVMFIVKPLRKLAQIARETFAGKDNSRFYYLTVGLQASLIAYLVSSFFLSIAYTWYVYYLVAYSVCLRRLYESETGKAVALEVKKAQKNPAHISSLIGEGNPLTI